LRRARSRERKEEVLPPSRLNPLALAALPIYAVVALVSAGFAILLGANPLVTESWLGEADTSGAAGVTMSLGLGAMLAAATAFATRAFVRRFAWARALHAELRPVVRDADDRSIALLAVSSGVAEELLFRGLLTPMIGVVLSAIVFGVVHQARGRGRVAWMAWAFVMGLLFGAIFRATGSLLGAIVAHVAINAANLRLLRDTDPEPKAARPLGGLLRRA
jgi:membrane protease YdiL (CAAX protease family)